MAEIALVHDFKRGFHRRIGADHDDVARHQFLSGHAADAIPPIRHRLHDVTFTENASDLTGSGHDQHGTNAARRHDPGNFKHRGFGRHGNGGITFLPQNCCYAHGRRPPVSKLCQPTSSLSGSISLL